MPAESAQPGPVTQLRPGASGLGDVLDWELPTQVGARMSTRHGGVSLGPFDSLNLGDHVGDDPAAVAANRAAWAGRLEGARPLWMRQVHGSEVVNAAEAVQAAVSPQADGCWTAEPGIACVVQVADCLPVLVAALNGRAVGAAHAGWRGLAAGVVERTAVAVARAAGCGPEDLICWLGPCIGQRQFEVGPDVVAAFGGGGRFVGRPRPDVQMRWLADLPGLARDRLAATGVHRVFGGTWCTVEDPLSFFSFRRDGVTGRQAAAIWLRG
jgi:YfiH family protein